MGISWTGHRTLALRLADREQEALEDGGWGAFSDVDGLISPGASFQTLDTASNLREGASSIHTMNSHLEHGSSGELPSRERGNYSYFRYLTDRPCGSTESKAKA